MYQGQKGIMIMKDFEAEKDLLFLKMDEIFSSKESMSPFSVKNKWRVVPYEAEGNCGNLLSSYSEGTQEDMSFDPQLKGWYKIYLGMLKDSVLSVKLTSDEAFLSHATSVTTHKPEYWGGNYIEESFWRCADMTGESLVISARKMAGSHVNSWLASIRFVPMTEKEIADWQAECVRQDTKRIYATDDMHNLLYFMNLESYEDWYPVVLKYRNSDVEWISMEEVRHFMSGPAPLEDLDACAYFRDGDRQVQKQSVKFDYDEVLRRLVVLGHKNGFQMSVSMRMGAWGLGFPYDQNYFDCPFMINNPDLRCTDRNGDVFSALSYAYEQVQQFMIEMLLNDADSGCDAVTLIAHRGFPYVQYEKPVAERFYAMYGEYPYELPLDEPRLHALHCQIMTEFMQKLRHALDERFGKNKVEIHLRALYSVLDTDYLGLDVKRWAKEGLVDRIISYPNRHYEKYDGDIWQENKEYRIDLEKYTDYVVTRGRSTNVHIGDLSEFEPPYTNYRGELCGPASEKERIQEWMQLEKEYGVKIYFEIMGRHYPNEVFKKRALELYENGAERIGMWDTYARAVRSAMWTTAGKLGHKEELADMDPESGYRIWRVRRLAGYDVSRYDPFWGG